MKYLNKLMVFCLSMLFGYGVDTFGYTYTIANMTDRDVNVQLHRIGGTLNKESGSWVGAYRTRKLHFGNAYCLSKIIAKSLDTNIGKDIELPVPIKIIDRQLFDATKDVIGKFTEAVKAVGKVAALAGPAGKAIATAIQGLPELVSSIGDIWKISFCRSRDFIFILDYDPVVKIDRIYALTPPE